MTIGKGCACGYSIAVSGVAEVPLWVYPTGDTTDAPIVHSMLAEGITTLLDAGVYELGFDCAALEGTEAPADPAEHIIISCTEIDCDAVEAALMCAKLNELIALLSVTTDAGALLEILAEIKNLCTKINATNTELAALCVKMLAVVAALEALCTKQEATTEAVQALCTKLEGIVAELAALCEKWEAVIMDAPECGGDVTGGNGGTPVGEPHNYPGNLSNTTFFSIQPGNDFVIDNAPVTEAPAVAFINAINACIDAGNNALVTFNGPQGSATGTFTSTVANTQNSTTPLTDVSGTVPIKVTSGVVQCVTKADDPVPTEGKVLATFDACAVFCLKAIKDILTAAQNCTMPLAVKIAGITKTICCTGGLTDATPRCYTVYDAMLNGPAQENCTYTLPGGEVVESYTQADFEATLNDGWVAGPDVDGGKTYYADMGTTIGITKRCYSGGIITNPDGVIVGTGSLVASISVAFSVPNTTVAECKDMLDVKEKNSEPIAGILGELLEWTKDNNAKLCDANEMASDALTKQCLLDDFWMNCAPESPLVSPLDKEAGTLVLEGDVVENYTAGTTIALKDAAGNICGEAIVADVETPAVFTEPSEASPTGFTTVTITDCELAEGKTPVQIKTAKPVLVATVKAVKAVVKNVSILQAKTLVKAQVAVRNTKAVVAFSATSMTAEAGAFQTGDVVTLMSESKAVLGKATIGEIAGTKYALSDNTVPEASFSAVKFATEG